MLITMIKGHPGDLLKIVFANLFCPLNNGWEVNKGIFFVLYVKYRDLHFYVWGSYWYYQIFANQMWPILMKCIVISMKATMIR